jgi:hypothetical protein
MKIAKQIFIHYGKREYFLICSIDGGLLVNVLDIHVYIHEKVHIHAYDIYTRLHTHTNIRRKSLLTHTHTPTTQY